MSTCEQELCANWTGDACVCDVLEIEPPSIKHNQRHPNQRMGCRECFGVACEQCDTGQHGRCTAKDKSRMYSCCCDLYGLPA